eukprot:6763543-Lingulodinium_polyedra.AAC.1
MSAADSRYKGLDPVDSPPEAHQGDWLQRRDLAALLRVVVRGAAFRRVQDRRSAGRARWRARCCWT